MLIEPASKVAVPPIVVKRTRSRVPPSVMEPAPKWFCPLVVSAMTDENAHKFEPIKQMVALPLKVAADPTTRLTGNPVVIFPLSVEGAMNEFADR